MAGYGVQSCALCISCFEMFLVPKRKERKEAG